MVVIVICLLMFKTDNKNVDSSSQFCLGSIHNEFGAIDSREVSLHRNAHGFSVDYRAINKSDILDVNK